MYPLTPELAAARVHPRPTPTRLQQGPRLNPPISIKPLAALLKDVRNCTLCAAHLQHGPRPVLQADVRARILIAGQAPGRKVHASGVPFDDASGVRLRRWLGLEPAQFYDPGLVAILPMGFVIQARAVQATCRRALNVPRTGAGACCRRCLELNSR
jgi:uracil-DNA glycosylase